MKLFNFLRVRNYLISGLLIGSVLFSGLMAPIVTEAAIIVTGSGPVEDNTSTTHYEDHHEDDSHNSLNHISTSASHPLCHGDSCHIIYPTTTRPHIAYTTTTTTHPICHTTYNCNTSTWQCVEAICGTGQYSSYSDCIANCKAPTPTRYACNTNTWQCYQTSSGPYTSLSNCQANCQPPITRYSCNTNTWQCYQTPSGQYTSLSSCESCCQPPITRYSCNTNTWQCVVDNFGPYTSLSTCESQCQPPITRYSCNTNTWQCYQDASGPYTSYSNCLNACQQIIPSLSVSCYASPSSAQINQTITFYSNVSGGIGNYSYYWSGVASGYNSYYQRSFTSPGTYTAYLTVYDSQGRSASTSCNAYINGGSQCTNPPTINLWADKYILRQGETTYLRWTSSYTNYCVASNGWSGTKSTSGIETVSPTANTTYTLTCYGYGSCGSTSQSIAIYTTSPGTNLNLTKLGRNLSGGSRIYSKVIQVVPGDIIEFHLTISAGSNADIHNVVIKDPLPATLIYKPGTTKVDGITQADTLTTTGLSLGTIYRATSKTITFQASTSAYSPTYLSQTNTAEATADNQNKVTDSATISYGLVAGAATVKTGAGSSLLVSLIISLILSFVIWYYLKFNPNGRLVLAKIESKTRDAYLAYSRYQIAHQNTK